VRIPIQEWPAEKFAQQATIATRKQKKAMSGTSAGH
jgi:hypothetical protein